MVYFSTVQTKTVKISSVLHTALKLLGASKSKQIGQMVEEAITQYLDKETK